jgi:membrane fusion protein, multidrug efflux system
MKSFWTWTVLLLVGIGIGGAGYWLGHRNGAAASAAEGSPGAGEAGEPVSPIATVRVAPIRRSTIVEEITAYGTVTAPVSEVRVLSVPFEARVTKMLVTPGGTVAANQPLIEVEGSAATALAVEEARNTASAAERDLQLVRQRFEQKLATNSELYTAENGLRTAQARLQSLQKGGAGGPRQLAADVAGIVSKVDVQPGQVVPAGSPLVEVAAHNQIEVKLGAEPEDASFLKPGMPVQLRMVSDGNGPAIEGKIRLISQRVDPVTRLVDVLASLPPDAKLMLDAFVAGKVAKASADALVVPREAVLPDNDGGYTLYTVRGGKAVKHSVQVGLQTDRDVQVSGKGLQEGEPAVVVGNYELQDGASVEVERAATQPSTTALASEVTR